MKFAITSKSMEIVIAIPKQPPEVPHPSYAVRLVDKLRIMPPI